MLSIILSSCGVTSKVRQSLIPERQEVKKIPKSYNIKVKDITFQTKESLSLKGWWIKGTNNITIVLSHSFGANRSGWEGSDAKGNHHKIDWLPSIKVLADHGYNIIAFDHRACGESEGDLTYFGKKEAQDIVAAVNWVKSKNRNLKKFGIIGFSSGANATLRAINILEKEQKELQLTGIAVNLYWYERMIKNSMAFFANTPSFIVPIIKKITPKVVGFNPEKEINPANTLSKIKAPILIVNSEFDEIASVSTIKDIYKKRVTNTELQILEEKERFYAYHFIEKQPETVINYINKNLNEKKMKNNNEQVAIISIEFQKSWTNKGFFNRLIKKELKRNNVIKNTINLLNFARENEITVMQAPLLIDKKDKNYKKMPFPAKLFGQLTKGTWKAEFTEGIYKQSDIVAVGRYGFDATKGSNLENLLQRNKIKTIYVCGFTTDHCVKETMNSLIEKGYKCIMVSDCTATRNKKTQDKIEQNFEIISSKELIKALKD
jgi:nicotinamidase-related amidase/alpha/beta superfamily hydrolase